MKTIFLPRQAGKTYALIDIAHREDLYIVVKDVKEARRIFEFAQRQNMKIRFPITFSDISQGQFYGAGVKKILIDNADYFINYFCPGLEVAAISLTRHDGDLY